MLTPLIPTRSLRSNNGSNFSVLRVKTNIGARAFCSCGPTLSNRLPLFVRTAPSTALFRRLLKTYLSDLVFPPIVSALCTPADCLLMFLDRTLDIGFWTLICLVRHWAWPPPGVLVQCNYIWLTDWLKRNDPKICSLVQGQAKKTGSRTVEKLLSESLFRPTSLAIENGIVTWRVFSDLSRLVGLSIFYFCINVRQLTVV